MSQTCGNQQGDIGEDCLGMALDIQSLEMVESFCFFGEAIWDWRRCIWQCYIKDQETTVQFRDLVVEIYLVGQRERYEQKREEWYKHS